MPPPKFAYDASAVGISASLKRPPLSIPSQLTCALAPQGGFASARSGNSVFISSVSIASGSARLSGQVNERESSWDTLLEVELEGISLFGQIDVGRIDLKLRSTYPWTARTPQFSAEGSRIEGIYIRKQPVRVRIDGALRQDESRPVSRPSLVSEVSADARDFWIDDHVLVVHGFGRLRFGELIMTSDKLQATMLSVEADSGEVVGEVAVASGMVNGYPVPLAPEFSEGAGLPEPPPDPEVVQMNERELEEVLGALRAWASSHPSPNEPFLYLMGRVLTPKEFLLEAAQRTRIGVVYLNSLARQARRNRERPVDIIRRTVEANRPEEP